MSFTPPTPGSKIALTVTAVVEFADEASIHFEGGIQVESNSTFEDDGNDVSFETLSPTPSTGDVGVFYDYLSKRAIVLYRYDTDASLCGWYTASGDRVPYSKVRPISKEQFAELLFSQDVPATSDRLTPEQVAEIAASPRPARNPRDTFLPNLCDND